MVQSTTRIFRYGTSSFLSIICVIVVCSWENPQSVCGLSLPKKRALKQKLPFVRKPCASERGDVQVSSLFAVVSAAHSAQFDHSSTQKLLCNKPSTKFQKSQELKATSASGNMKSKKLMPLISTFSNQLAVGINKRKFSTKMTIQSKNKKIVRSTAASCEKQQSIMMADDNNVEGSVYGISSLLFLTFVLLLAYGPSPSSNSEISGQEIWWAALNGYFVTLFTNFARRETKRLQHLNLSHHHHHNVLTDNNKKDPFSTSKQQQPKPKTIILKRLPRSVVAADITKLDTSTVTNFKSMEKNFNSMFNNKKGGGMIAWTAMTSSSLDSVTPTMKSSTNNVVAQEKKMMLNNKKK